MNKMKPSFDAVLFDCDGVLVDSEPITNGVLRDMLAERGWDLSPAECVRVFLGRSVRDLKDDIEAHTGQPLTEDWLAAFRARRDVRLAREVRAMPGAREAVEAARAGVDGRIACASGADRAKVELMLARVGLAPLFQGQVFSGHEMPRSKPAPDVYLAAARALGVAPARCLVIDDTPVGVTAGVAAGATVWALCPPANERFGTASPQDLRAAGAARIFECMDELPALLAPSLPPAGSA
jgi:HAD superfamily hydrolase (TIGR01509 family)